MKRELSTLVLAAAVVAPAHAAHVGFWDATFQLDVAQEVPAPNRSGGFGQCVSSLQGTELTLSCTHNVSDAIAAHVHLGLPGRPGPVLVPLGDGASPIQAVLELTEDQRAYYGAGALYVNIHTEANPAGEIRGQIVPRVARDATGLLFSGDATQQPAQVESDASAACRAILSSRAGGDDLRVLCGHSVEGAIAAHIHRGAPGESGPVIYPFDSPASPLDQTFAIEEGDVEDLFAGNLYVNIHTAAFPAGEVRANLVGCFESDTRLCLQQNRFSVRVEGMSPSGEQFTAQAFARTGSSGELSFFTPDNLELLVKVLDGCAINDRYWVFFAATTDVEFDLTVTDTTTGDEKTYSNPQGAPADAVTDTSAFDTCTS